MDVHSHEFARGPFLHGDDGTRDVTAVHVCLNDDALGTYAAMTLRRSLKDVTVPVVVRMSEEAGLATLLGASADGHAVIEGVEPIGMLEMTCTLEIVLGGTREVLARAIHQGYVERHVADGAMVETNPSMVPWEQLRDDLKESNRQQADHTSVKLAAVGCELVPSSDGDVALIDLSEEEYERMAQMEHDRWVAERLASGWRLGETKDVDKKISPHLVPWEQFDDEFKEYDRYAVRLIPRVFAKADYEIRRK
jgi:hypothetical protein